MTAAVHPLAQAVQPLARRAAPDAELVARFVESRDEPAFAELVRRHGPTVLAVCRHVTRHAHDADDAFQATFLVLARKAHTLDPARPVGAWLRGVATRAGRKAAGRRRHLPLVETARPEPDDDDGEAVAAVRAAVAGLPAHQRQAVERCELLGRSRAAVAAELGVRPGTLSSRLALARRALAARLRRQGFAPVAAVVPPGLLAAARATASEVSSPRVSELAEAIMRTTKLGWVAGVLATVAVTVGVGLAAEPAPAPRPADEPAKRDDGRLVLSGRDERVWLNLDGTVAARVTAKDVRAAGADLRQVLVRLLPPDIRDDFATAGVPLPNGDLPIETRAGVMLLNPADPPAVRPLTVRPLDGVSLSCWSADGRHAVALDENTDKYTWLDTATGEQTPLAVPAGQQVWGRSPDGDWLLTTPSNHRTWLEQLLKPQKWGGPLFRVGRDGTATPLLGGEEVKCPGLSPDGRRLTFASLDPNTATHTMTLWVSDLDGGRRTAVATHPHALLYAVWSPDGSRLAYTELRFPPEGGVGVQHLWVCDADGGNRREVPLPEGVVGGLLAWR